MRAPLRYHLVAARMEWTPGRAIERMRQGAGNHRQCGAGFPIEAWDRTQQSFGVRMLGSRARDSNAPAAHTVERFGHLDILVNNAGVSQRASVMDLDRAT